MTTELTAQEYEREAKATRHRLARNLDEHRLAEFVEKVYATT